MEITPMDLRPQDSATSFISETQVKKSSRRSKEDRAHSKMEKTFTESGLGEEGEIDFYA